MHSVPTNSSLFYYAEANKLGGFAYITGEESGLNFVFSNGYDSTDIYHTIIKPRSQQKKKRYELTDALL